MAHVIQGGVNFDNMAAKMLGHVVIPASYSADATFESIQSLVQALIDLSASARTLTAGGTMAINLYQGNGANTISALQSDVTEIPINGDVNGIIDTYDENGVPIRLEWKTTYLDQAHVG
jgi:hypothetical protein